MSFPSKIGYPIDMNKNAINNPVFQRLASAPASPVAGQYYVNTTDGLLYKRNEANTAWEQVGGSNVVEITHTSLTTLNLSNANKDVVIRLTAYGPGTLTINTDANTTASPRLFVYRYLNDIQTVTINLGGATSEVVLAEWEAVEYIYNPANASYEVTNIFTLPVTGAINDDLELTFKTPYSSTTPAPIRTSWSNIKTQLLQIALTGYSVGTNAVLAATDTILQAFGKLQAQINGKENSITAGTTAQYWRGDKSWQTLDKTAVGLSNVPNTDATNRANHTGTQLSSTISDFNTAVDARVAAGTVGLWDDRGNYDASVGTFPTTGGSGAAGAILKGDVFRVSVAGTLGGVAYQIGGSFRALVDSPGQTAGNWATITQDDNTGGVSYATSAEAKAKTESAKAVPPTALADFTYASTATNFGNGTLTQFDFTHSFSEVANVEITENATGIIWGFLITKTSATNVRVNCATAPTTNQFKIVITGK